MSFVNDLINLTQGQLLIKYWWLWISIIVFSVSSTLLTYKIWGDKK